MIKFLKNPLIIFVLFLALGLGLYANSFNNVFFWDDDDIIVNNIYIKDWRYLPKFFTENLIAGSGQITNYYRPLSLLSFSVDYHLWGLDPFGFHLVNTLIHIAGAFLLWLILCRLLSVSEEDKFGESAVAWLAFLPSLFFLIHPLQTEAVAYISGRADPLSTFFILLSLWFFIGWREKSNKPKLKLVISLLFFICALLSKEQAVLLPAFVILVDWIFFTKKTSGKEFLCLLRRSLPFFIISAIYLLLHFTTFNFKGSMDFSYHNSVYDSSVFVRLLTFSSVMLSYFKLLFAPLGLHMAWEITPVISFFSFPVIVCLLAFSILAVIGIGSWKKIRLPAFGFLWFLIMLLPRTNIFSINRPLYEHWLYLPLFGFFLAIFSWLFFLWRDRIKNPKIAILLKKVFCAIIIIYCVWLGILTILRNQVWRDPIIFYENNLSYTPNSHIQHNNLGMAYANAGRDEEAILEYRKGIELYDVYPQIHYNLANSLLATGKLEEARDEYEQAIKMSPEFALAYGNLYNVYISLGEKEKASALRDEFRKKFNYNL